MEDCCYCRICGGLCIVDCPNKSDAHKEPRLTRAKYCNICRGSCLVNCPNNHTIANKINATEGISAEQLERCKINFEEIEKRIPLNNPEFRMTDEERAQLEILGNSPSRLGITFGAGTRALMGVADDMQRLELNTAQRQMLAYLGAIRTEQPKITQFIQFTGKRTYRDVAAALSATATPDNCRPAGKTKNTKFKQSNDWYKKRGRK